MPVLLWASLLTGPDLRRTGIFILMKKVETFTRFKTMGLN